MPTCPACLYPYTGPVCENPGCIASGNVPPEILTCRERDRLEERERQRVFRIRERSFDSGLRRILRSV